MCRAHYTALLSPPPWLPLRGPSCARVACSLRLEAQRVPTPQESHQRLADTVNRYCCVHRWQALAGWADARGDRCRPRLYPECSPRPRRNLHWHRGSAAGSRLRSSSWRSPFGLAQSTVALAFSSLKHQCPLISSIMSWAGASFFKDSLFVVVGSSPGG